MEPVQGQGAISPDLRSWVEGLRTAGVRIPQPIINLARSASLGSGESAEGAIQFSSVAQPSEAPPVASSGSQGLSYGLSQGLGHASGWFDESVNVGVSSSAASASALRVSFSIPSSVGEEEMETASVSGDISQPSDAPRKLCRLLAQFCREAFVGSAPAAPKTCQFEGLFSEVTRVPKEEFTPVLFHRVAKLLTEACHRFETAAAAGKAPHASLPVKKRPLASSSDPAFGKAASFNPSLPRLVGNLSGNRSAGVPLHEVGRLEALSRQLSEAQSVSFWIFNAILNWLKQEGFQPSDASLFEELVPSFFHLYGWLHCVACFHGYLLSG